jgi:hypothetical protein
MDQALAQSPSTRFDDGRAHADDFVCGFQHEDETRRFMAELKEPFKEFDLTLHEQKIGVQFVADATHASNAGPGFGGRECQYAGHRILAEEKSPDL